MLKRHLGYSRSVGTQTISLLADNSKIQSMFLNLAYHSKPAIEEK